MPPAAGVGAAGAAAVAATGVPATAGEEVLAGLQYSKQGQSVAEGMA